MPKIDAVVTSHHEAWFAFEGGKPLLFSEDGHDRLRCAVFVCEDGNIFISSEPSLVKMLFDGEEPEEDFNLRNYRLDEEKDTLQ